MELPNPFIVKDIHQEQANGQLTWGKLLPEETAACRIQRRAQHKKQRQNRLIGRRQRRRNGAG